MRRRRNANQGLGRFAKFVWGGLGLGALVAAYAAAFAYELLPAPKQFASDMVCRARHFFQEPAPGSQFTILISNLSGDTDGRQTDRIWDAFIGQRGVDVRRTCRVVALGSIDSSMADAEAKALAEGHALLEEQNADILIWGKVNKADEELTVWFLSREWDTTLPSPSYSTSEGTHSASKF